MSTAKKCVQIIKQRRKKYENGCIPWRCREREVFLKSSKKETTRGNCAQKGRTVIFGEFKNGNITETVYINYNKIVLQNI